MKILLLSFLLFCPGAYSQEGTLSEEEAARKRILEQYGDINQYEESVKDDRELRAFEEEQRVKKEKESKKIDPFRDHINQRKMGNLDSEMSDEEALAAQNQKIQEITKQVLNQKGLQGNGSLNENFLTGVMNDKMKESLKKMIKSNPFSHMSKREVASTFLERTQGTALGGLLKKNPKALKVLTNVCHDKDALPSFLSIVNKPKKMKSFSGAVLVIFVIVFSLNLMNSKANILKRLMVKFFLMGAGAAANFSAFYFIFKDELGPMVAVISKSL